MNKSPGRPVQKALQEEVPLELEMDFLGQDQWNDYWRPQGLRELGLALDSPQVKEALDFFAARQGYFGWRLKDRSLVACYRD